MQCDGPENRKLSTQFSLQMHTPVFTSAKETTYLFVKIIKVIFWFRTPERGYAGIHTQSLPLVPKTGVQFQNHGQ